MSDAIISINHISKSFGKKQVLQDITLEIPAGETFALLGRNGAGKTTTLQIMMGLLPADAGTIRISGIDPASDPLQLRRQVGYLAEDQVMYPWMTPMELCLFLEPFYPTWDQEWAVDFLDRFEIPRHARIGKLSKGQSVKLGLAVALAHRPKVVLLDDPAMGLDPIARKEFNRDLVEHLQSSGCTVLYSSHLLDEVEAVADAVAILDQGRLLKTARTEPLREEVKQLILPYDAVAGSAPPAGLLDVRRHEDRLVLVTEGAQEYLQQLQTRGTDVEVVDLRLDEIFEAFVIGRMRDWPSEAPSAPAMSV